MTKYNLIIPYEKLLQLPSNSIDEKIASINIINEHIKYYEDVVHELYQPCYSNSDTGFKILELLGSDKDLRYVAINDISLKVEKLKLIKNNLVQELAYA